MHHVSKLKIKFTWNLFKHMKLCNWASKTVLIIMPYTDMCNGACNLLRYANFKACANLVGVNSQLCFLAFLWSFPSLFISCFYHNPPLEGNPNFWNPNSLEPKCALALQQTACQQVGKTGVLNTSIGRVFFARGISPGQNWWGTLLGREISCSQGLGRPKACTQGALPF